MYYYVYQITNLINGKIYVGKHKSSKHPDVNNYFGSGTQIIAAINKYGRENFKKEVLYYCSSLEEMSKIEAEIVTLEFVRRGDTYNMHVGGAGGWCHINDVPVTNRINIIAFREKVISGEITPGGDKSQYFTEVSLSKIREGSMKGNAAIKNRTTEQKEITSKKKSAASSGTGNSQYGKLWITNVITKETKRWSINDVIPDGWVRGKTGRQITKCWVNNGKTETLILKSDLSKYLKMGFVNGRTLTNIGKAKIR